MTDAERVLWRDIRKDQLGSRFHRQFPIPPYIADFACIEARLIVECDGGQHVDSIEACGAMHICAPRVGASFGSGTTTSS